MDAQSLLGKLTNACTSRDNSIRLTRRLEPAMGEGTKVFPPTFPSGPARNDPPTYLTEERRIGDEVFSTVVLDTVQSEANRLELSLLEAMRRKELSLPLLQTEIPNYGLLTSLEAPHRVFDAIFRDSEIDGKLFHDTDIGKYILTATGRKAYPLYRYCPTLLIFGGWNSHGARGGLGEKFPRGFDAEIVGWQIERGRHGAGRMDPIGFGRAVDGKIYKSRDGWTFDKDKAIVKKGKKPEDTTHTEVGHGTIPPTLQELGGVSISYAVQTSVLSFPRLRQLRFADPKRGLSTPDQDVACRTVLAALYLYALSLQQEEGFLLRSRCHLLPSEDPKWEWLGATAKEIEDFSFDSQIARQVVQDAVSQAEQKGMSWETQPINMKASDKLTKALDENRRLLEMGEEVE